MKKRRRGRVKMKEKKREESGDSLKKFEVMASTQSDFAKTDSYQKVVKFTHDGVYVVTGGVDGVVRVWKYPSLDKVHTLVGHENEIEDLDCHPSRLQMVSVCRGGEAIVWDLQEGKKENNFEWSPDKTSKDQRSKYKFRACCFSPQPNTEVNGATDLFTINVPLKWNPRAGHHSYMIQWDTTTWQPSRVRKTGRELLCALAVSHSGSLVAMGTTDGNISVYNSRDLKLLTRVSRVHSVFVTGLTFVPARNQQPVNQLAEALLSVSADRTCCVTMVTTQSGVSTVVLLFILLPLLVVLVAMATTLFL